MADFKYIMQGFQKDINFFDEIKEVLETEDYTSIWILTAFVNERAICNLMPSIKKSKADISFIIGIRNNVSTYQALKCLINMKVSVFVFDTARIESIFHASIDVYTSAGYMLRIDCWEAEKDLKTTYGSECALTSLAVDEPLEYARLYLEGNLQMWVDAEDSLELY